MCCPDCNAILEIPAPLSESPAAIAIQAAPPRLGPVPTQQLPAKPADEESEEEPEPKQRRSGYRLAYDDAPESASKRRRAGHSEIDPAPDKRRERRSRSRPTGKTRRLRDAIFGGIGVLWGAGILFVWFLNDFEIRGGTYGAGQITGTVLGALLFFVGLFYLYRDLPPKAYGDDEDLDKPERPKRRVSRYFDEPEADDEFERKRNREKNNGSLKG